MEKKPVKIVTIGGGSSYTPELMEGFIKRYDELPIREIWLVDIEDGKEKLEIVGAMAQRMWDASPYDVKVHMTLDRREALPGADFVTTQFRVGLLNARIKDERIPFSYGMLGQETNGAGGIFKAFRTIPAVSYTHLDVYKRQVLPVICQKLKGKENLLFFIGVIFTLTVAFSRIIVGAHFLTDVTIGMSVTFLIEVIFVYKLWKKDNDSI